MNERNKNFPRFELKRKTDSKQLVGKFVLQEILAVFSISTNVKVKLVIQPRLFQNLTRSIFIFKSNVFTHRIQLTYFVSCDEYLPKLPTNSVEIFGHFHYFLDVLR